jgi:hypothetical protein
MTRWLLIGFFVLAGAVGWYVYETITSKLMRLTPEVIERLQATVAAENEMAIAKPSFREREVLPPNPLKNVYFGDLHVHTSLSFDAYIAGNRIGPTEAYRFAKGEAIALVSSEVVQLTTPLDFVAITDHAESFGLFEGCADPEITPKQEQFCAQFDNPSLSLFRTLRSQALQRPPIRPDYCGEDGSFCIRHGRTTWQSIQQAADAAYEPGIFTSLYGYEYSPVWPRGGSTHRNVIFRSRSVPDTVVSAYDAGTAIDLWKILESTCVGECEFLTIPHNLNRYYGKAFSFLDEDGNAYSESDWLRRRSFEPLVEVFQAKASSECALGVGTTDEECGFEQFFPLCDEGKGDEGETEACAGSNSFARDGLKFGLQLEGEMGFNPLRFGFVGSTDAHNSNPGDTEEWDYRGKTGLRDATAKKRLADHSFGPGVPITHNPGGLAAIWAEENVRQAIFDGLKARETYGTSGTRIKLRVFAGWDFQPHLLEDSELITKAYDGGVPMGGVLEADQDGKNPKFIVWASKDPVHGNLDRIQVIKGWRENGLQKERVFDIACSDGLTPDAETGQCADSRARVDLQTCRISADTGAAELKVLWEDRDFDSKNPAFYYFRVLQIPTCRWSTYDAIRLGQDPIKEVSATIRERAWSSSIWYSP